MSLKEAFSAIPPCPPTEKHTKALQADFLWGGRKRLISDGVVKTNSIKAQSVKMAIKITLLYQ